MSTSTCSVERSDAVLTHHDALARTIDVFGFLSRERVFTYAQYHANTEQFTSELYIYERMVIANVTDLNKTKEQRNYTSDDLKEAPRESRFQPYVLATHADSGEMHEFRMWMDGVLRRYHTECPDKWLPCIVEHGVEHECTDKCLGLDTGVDEDKALMYYNLYLENQSFVDLPPHTRIHAASKASNN